MGIKFDIFRKQPDGRPVWMKAVEGLEEARFEVAYIAKELPGEYFIYDTRNGSVIPAEKRNTHFSWSPEFDTGLAS